MTERTLQNAIINLLRLNGWFAYSQKTVGTYDPIKKIFRKNKSATIGVADILAIKHGRVLFLEVKRPGGKQRNSQIEFEYQIKTHGGNYFVVTSYKEVEKIIGESNG